MRDQIQAARDAAEARLAAVTSLAEARALEYNKQRCRSAYSIESVHL